VTDDQIRELGAILMAAQVHKIAFDAETTRRQQAWDLRKFIIATLVSAVLALAAAIGAGVGIGNLIWAHREATPTQQFILPPGTTIQIGPGPSAK
jgi:MFS superfamily sulfate permease-like transporter